VDNFRAVRRYCDTLLDVDIDEIDGYRIRRALGAGSVGTAWLARDLATGRSVVIKRVPASAVPAPEVLRRDLALARGLDHPHVVGLIEVRQVSREWLLVSDFAPAGSLTDLLNRRGPLSTGELVTLLTPIALALTAAHRIALTHNHLGTGDIVFTADGHPLLSDLGLRSTTPDTNHPPDQTALAAVAHESGADPTLFPDTLFTTDLRSLPNRLLAISKPAPIGLAFGRDHNAVTFTPISAPNSASTVNSDLNTRPTTRITGSTRPVIEAGAGSAPPVRRLIGLIAALVIAAGIAAGLAITHDDATAAGRSPFAVPGASSASTALPERPTTNPDPIPDPTANPSADPTTEPSAGPTRATGLPLGGRSAGEWAAVLGRLDAIRALAFGRLDVGLLDSFYRRGTAPWRSDRALMDSYRSCGVRIEGLRMEVRSVAVARAGRSVVVLRVVDRFAGGTAVDASGQHTVLPHGPFTARLITLDAEGGALRISAVVRA
jgi:serine/threonine protein kinase